MAKRNSKFSVSVWEWIRVQGASPKQRIRFLIWATILVVAVAFAYFVLTAPGFLTLNNAINMSQRSAPDIILAVAQTMVILTGGIDLSVGAVAAFSGSLAAVAFCYWNIPIWPAILLSLLAGAALGAVSGLIITKGGVPDFIATLGTMTTIRGLALILTGGLPVPSHVTAVTLKAYLPPEIIWLGNGFILGIPSSILISLVFVGIGWVILTRTMFGRAIFAVGGNKTAAAISGVNVQRTKTLTYVLSGLLAALAGVILTGRMNSANALMADGAELQSIASVVIGGTNLFGGEGGVIGSFFGAIIMAILRNVLNLQNVHDFAQKVFMGLMIIGVVLFDQLRRRYGR